MLLSGPLNVSLPRWVCGEVSSDCSFVKTAVSLRESEEFLSFVFLEQNGWEEALGVDDA